jgi:hypothetical protein
MAEIYGLMSTRDYRIRYVGQTKGYADKRAWDHWRSSSNSRVAVWSREELWSGYQINYVVIEECEEGHRCSRETYWMRRIPQLLNDRKAKYTPAKRSDADTIRIDELEKIETGRDIDNWHGFVGITYYPPAEATWSDARDEWTQATDEAWGVRVYDPFGKNWGEIPGLAELQFALELRERLRQSAKLRHVERFGIALSWPPDVLQETARDELQSQRLSAV